jgi:hypothetical protein
MDTGGYTGAWGPNGKLAILHEKEQVLNKEDTQNLFDAVALLKLIDLQSLAMNSGFGNFVSPPVVIDIPGGPID